MMGRLALTTALCIAVSAIGVSSSRAQTGPDMTPMQLQSIQAHEYEATKGAVFASVVDVLQDFGFTIASADLNTGFISAESPTSSTGNKSDAFWWGGSTASSRVTAFIETMANGRTRVRLNFVSRKNRLGWSYTMEHHEKAVTDPDAYRRVFDKIDEALFVRKAIDAPATPPPAAAATQHQ